jgi:5-methylcytosine-specific restriction endonuclease McrA
MSKQEQRVECPICERTLEYKDTSEHHLVPKSRKGKNTVRVCVPCGKMIHKLISLKEMEQTYNTIETILQHEGVRKWVKWISKRPNTNVTTATKKRKYK